MAPFDEKVLVSPGSIALDNWRHTAKPQSLGDIADEGARRIKADLAKKRAAARRAAARSSAKAREFRDRFGAKARVPLQALYSYGPIWLWSYMVMAYMVVAYIVMALAQEPRVPLQALYSYGPT